MQQARILRAQGAAWQRWWLILGIGFCVLSMDEIAGMHEWVNSMLGDTPWTVIGAPIFALVGLAYIPFLWHHRWRTGVLFLLAGAIYGGLAWKIVPPIVDFIGAVVVLLTVDWRMAVALILFVFTTLLTWSYYGERAITFLYDRIPGSTLGGEKILHRIWRVLWCVGIFIGASRESDLIWRMGDIANALMVLPNLLGLLLLSGVVFALARGNRTAGKDFHADTPEEPEEY